MWSDFLCNLKKKHTRNKNASIIGHIKMNNTGKEQWKRHKSYNGAEIKKKKLRRKIQVLTEKQREQQENATVTLVQANQHLSDPRGSTSGAAADVQSITILLHRRHKETRTDSWRWDLSECNLAIHCKWGKFM